MREKLWQKKGNTLFSNQTTEQKNIVNNMLDRVVYCSSILVSRFGTQVGLSLKTFKEFPLLIVLTNSMVLNSLSSVGPSKSFPNNES